MPSGIYKRTLKSLSERLFKHTVKTEQCWLWVGPKQLSGYGQISYGDLSNRQAISSHRLSWQLHNGPIPDGLSVLHKCDVRNCVNPAHLFLGTQADNMRDMKEKKRGAVGTQLPQTKLTKEIVLEIRNSEEPNNALARKFGVSRAAINQIRLRNRWKYV